MSLREALAEEYISQCRIRGEKGYSKLSSQRQEIKDYLLSFFDNNGYEKSELESWIELYDMTIFEFLDDVMTRGSRSLGWPNFYEDELRKRLLGANNSRQ